MCVRYSSLGNVAVDSVAPHKIFRLEKLLVTHPLEILSFLWKLQVYGVFMTAIRRAK